MALNGLNVRAFDLWSNFLILCESSYSADLCESSYSVDLCESSYSVDLNESSTSVQCLCKYSRIAFAQTTLWWEGRADSILSLYFGLSVVGLGRFCFCICIHTCTTQESSWNPSKYCKGTSKVFAWYWGAVGSLFLVRARYLNKYIIYERSWNPSKYCQGTLNVFAWCRVQLELIFLAFSQHCQTSWFV